jgi:hypothetical protein
LISINGGQALNATLFLAFTLFTAVVSFSALIIGLLMEMAQYPSDSNFLIGSAVTFLAAFSLSVFAYGRSYR